MPEKILPHRENPAKPSYAPAGGTLAGLAIGAALMGKEFGPDLGEAINKKLEKTKVLFRRAKKR